ncbi:MAG: F0F1 ATP synthase subunit delta [Akkermansiaceae bacterium]|nr:F0F1 ATP synthase subunit delta [Armatimonadota bacterium]
MREESVARRYASAYLQVALKSGDLIASQDNLRRAADTVANHGMLKSLLNQPQVTTERKRSVLSEVLKDEATPATLGFLHLLTDKRRIDLLGEIATELERLVRDRQNIARATAVTAEPLHPSQLSALKVSLEKRTGKTIELSTEIDPSLLGGVLVRIGDTVMDGSVRGKLDRLHEELIARK